MIPQLRAFPLLACLALTLLACRLAGRITGQAAMLTPTASQMPATLAVRDFPSPAALSTPTQAPASASPASVATPTSLPTAAPPAAARPKPPQSWAAEIRPTEMRTALTHLSDLIGFRVLDENGGLLGIAADYIINTCETYIIYILLAPGSDPNAEPVSRAAIPFEAVTINSGVLDAQGRAIHLHLLPGQLSGAPVLPAGAPLTPTDWEAAVREFWSGAVRISNLTTRCNATGGPVYKVAYASELLGAKLYDGRGELLGEIQEAILEPESGKLGFYILKPAQGEGLVMVRLGATNIPQQALEPGALLSLVLLTEQQMFWQAPRLDTVDEADDFAVQGRMRQYWGR